MTTAIVFSRYLGVTLYFKWPDYATQILLEKPVPAQKTLD